MNVFWTAGLVIAGAILNVLGVVLLKHSAVSGSATAAIAGAIAWAATSVVYLTLLKSSDHPLAVLSTVTSAAGFLAVIAVGLAYGELLSFRQSLAIFLLIIGMVLLSL